MTPRPTTRPTELRDLVAKAKQRREEEHERVETEFWQEIDRLQRRYHGAQQDIADALDVKRNQILRQTKRYRSAGQDAVTD
ncbi:hypothetical protein [Streptomyces sp. WAC 01438]|uniref:hypothetical protein n=1 Tax=Streptomyces sp. WAC 01438 TaxID=2203204 RepID=UPI000F6BCD0B|nr:hypothetical protein [Streptomyces sp. WAC 01438]AZM64955.1 hypothetical protein DLM49_36250 [Streptomyces sp. WAC 01438]